MELLQCAICVSPTPETKAILFSVKKKLQILLNQYAPQFKENNVKQTKSNINFIQMLQIVFGDKFFQNSLSKNCNHQKICRYLKRKFKCDSKTFNQLCQQLSLKIGQKNYNFQVIASQIKSLSQTVLLLNSKKPQQKNKIKTAESIQLLPVPQPVIVNPDHQNQVLVDSNPVGVKIVEELKVKSEEVSAFMYYYPFFGFNPGLGFH